MLITLNSYSLPAQNLSEGDNYEVRYWYNLSFIDTSGQAVASGSATSGTQIRVAASVVDGFLVVEDSPIYTTVDALGPFPQSINLSCQVFKGNSATGIFPFNQSGCPSSWIIYNPSPATEWDFDSLTFLQQASYPAYQQQWMVTNQEMINYVNSIASVPDASMTVKGKTKLSVAPVSATNPIAVGDNDPRIQNIVTEYLSVLNYGAENDAAAIEDAVISLLTPTTLTSASGGLTSAAVGKVICVAGAGAAGATLITTISAVPSPTTFTLGAAASTAVTNTRAVYGTDNLNAFQDALDDAATSTVSNVVYIPEGNYLFSDGSLTVPQGVCLQGSWAYAPDHMGYRYANEVKPMSGLGTTLVITAEEGTPTGSFIFLNSMSAVRGVCMFYPSELASLSTPKQYPWAVEMFGTGPVVENVEILNPYQGIYSHIGQRHYVNNVRGTPLLTGLYASQQLETSRYLNITFVPIYTFSTTEIAPFPLTNLMTWIMQNGTAFKIGRVDNAVFYNCFTFNWLKGFKFVIDAPEVTSYANGTGAPGGRAWAQFTSCGADSCSYPIDVDDVQGLDATTAAGVTFSDGMFLAAQFTAFAGPELYGVYCRTTFTGRIGMTDCRFTGGVVNIVNAANGGRLDITGCYFQRWSVKAIDVNGTAAITGNTFKQGNTAEILASTASGLNAAWISLSSNVIEYADVAGLYNVHADANFSEAGNVYATSPKNVAVTYQNGWVDFGSFLETVSYIKRDGRVYLRGGAKNGTVGTGIAVFTLPAGFRPAASLVFAVTSNNAFGIIQVAASGIVSVESGNNASVFFDGINFAVR